MGAMVGTPAAFAFHFASHMHMKTIEPMCTSTASTTPTTIATVGRWTPQLSPWSSTSAPDVQHV